MAIIDIQLKRRNELMPVQNKSCIRISWLEHFLFETEFPCMKMKLPPPPPKKKRKIMDKISMHEIVLSPIFHCLFWGENISIFMHENEISLPRFFHARNLWHGCKTRQTNADIPFLLFCILNCTALCKNKAAPLCNIRVRAIRTSYLNDYVTPYSIAAWYREMLRIHSSTTHP